jgi:hypothetical protein
MPLIFFLLVISDEPGHFHYDSWDADPTNLTVCDMDLLLTTGGFETL